MKIDELSGLLGLKPGQLNFLFIMFFGTISPGLIILYHFHPTITERYDFFKLLIVASSLSLPFIVMCFIAVLMDAMAQPEPKSQVGSLPLAVLLADVLLYAGLFTAFVCHLALRTMLLLDVSVLAVYTLTVMIITVFIKLFRPSGITERQHFLWVCLCLVSVSMLICWFWRHEIHELVRPVFQHLTL